MRFRVKLICLVVVLGLTAGCAVDETAQVCHITTDAEVEVREQALAAQRAAAPTSDSTDGSVGELHADFGSMRQILRVAQVIPAGLEVRVLNEMPTVYLSARVVPEDMTCPTTIGRVAELRGMNGDVADVQIEVGQLLDTRQFGPAG